VKLQKDFENWWLEQCEIIEQKNQRSHEYELGRKPPTTADSMASSVASSIPSGASLVSNSRNSLNLNSANSNPSQTDKYYDVSSSSKPRLLPYLEPDR